MDTEGQPCLWRPGQPHVGSSGIGMLTYQPAKQKRTKTSCGPEKASYNRPSFLGPANLTVCVPHRIYRNAVPEKLLRIVWSDALSSGFGCPGESSEKKALPKFQTPCPPLTSLSPTDAAPRRKSPSRPLWPIAHNAVGSASK